MRARRCKGSSAAREPLRCVRDRVDAKQPNSLGYSVRREAPKLARLGPAASHRCRGDGGVAKVRCRSNEPRMQDGLEYCTACQCNRMLSGKQSQTGRNIAWIVR